MINNDHLATMQRVSWKVSLGAKCYIQRNARTQRPQHRPLIGSGTLGHRECPRVHTDN